MAAALAKINNIEALVKAILGGYKSHSTNEPEYRVTTSTRMLDWTQPTEAQQITPSLWRVGAIGDGNCLVHSLLFAMSESYRQEDNKYRALIADKFRQVLNARIRELKDIADAMYAYIGGWEALEESFTILKKHKRSEVNLEMGPVIARLYGLNLLAVIIQAGQLKPQVLTYNDGRYDPALPTVLVNYITWQIANLGQAAAAGAGAGVPVANHYEVIIAGAPVEGGGVYKFPSGTTTYKFRHTDPILAPLLVEFERPGREFRAEEEVQRIRARALEAIDEAVYATALAGAIAESPAKPRGLSVPRSGSATRKRSFASKTKSKSRSRSRSSNTKKPTLMIGSSPSTKKPKILISSRY
jgi:hypothetical protein